MPLILLTNDDGITSPGLQTLQAAISPLGQVVTVAPDRDNSAVSHSLTMNRPLRVQRLTESSYTLDGTPTDCVSIALGKILKRRPDLLISGINAGPNMGDDISYSGTVSAAVEGTMYAIPSMAVSLAGEPPLDFIRAGKVAARLAAMILARGLPENTLLNVNVPGNPLIAGTKVTRQGRRIWENSIQETRDPRGRCYYWIGGGTPLKDSAEDTDVHAIRTGYISITPIHLDHTNHEGIFHLRDDWQLEEQEL
ncbi:MAG: 5'/3'-nucleotidase SurE [Desulfocapsaceae bacterium]|nr:5'/3'-nucleotidase SurE [Desulfocapsaceae bacterium]